MYKISIIGTFINVWTKVKIQKAPGFRYFLKTEPSYDTGPYK